MIAALCAVVMCWGFWVMFKPHSAVQPADSLQGILFDHIERLPEVYSTHQSYTQRLRDDTCAILIYRYSPNMCNACYQEDLFNLRDFQETIGREKVLVLPAHPVHDRGSRVQMNSEMEGFRYRNIPVDSLALPFREGEGEKRYFAVIDKQGQIGMVFFPVMGRQELTQRYFKKVSRYLTVAPVAPKDSL